MVDKTIADFCCLLSMLLLQFHLYIWLPGDQSADVKGLLSEAWSRYWTVTSRRSVETAVMYVIMMLLLTACPAVCLYYSVRCTRLINSLHQYTHSLNNQTKVNSAVLGCRFNLVHFASSFAHKLARPVGPGPKRDGNCISAAILNKPFGFEFWI